MQGEKFHETNSIFLNYCIIRNHIIFLMQQQRQQWVIRKYVQINSNYQPIMR